jgi:CBS domain-containing protein
MKAADIMTKKLVTIDSLATIAAAAKKMKQHQIRALIVDRLSEEDAYGIITTTDISRVVANGQHPEKTYVCEVMTKPCIVVNPDLNIEHIAQLFARAKIRIAPVIKDKLLGIVSLTDVLTKTNDLNSIKAKLTPQEMVVLDELPLDRSMENQWNIESDNLYENWCSG